MSLIHVCLAFDPEVANVTPVLDFRFRPQEVVIVRCPERIRQARWLEDALLAKGIAVRHCDIPNSLDAVQIKERLSQHISRLVDDEVALNVTGGNQTMILGAYEAFREAQRPIFHIQHDRDQLVWLYPPGVPSADLNDKINIPEYLSVHGAGTAGTVIRSPVEGMWRSLTREIVQGIDKFTLAISVLNKLAGEAKERQHGIHGPIRASLKSYSKQNQVDELIDLFRRYGLLNRASNEITFSNEAARSYVNGGWLEEHVFALVQKVRPALELLQKTDSDANLIQDLAQNLRVVKKNGADRVENELDVAFIADNKLHIIECKTRRFDMGNGPDSHGAGVFYKLDTLRDHIGGLQAKAMLVSYKPLQDEHLCRARDLGIEVCVGKEIKNLESCLKTWIEGQ